MAPCQINCQDFCASYGRQARPFGVHPAEHTPVLILNAILAAVMAFHLPGALEGFEDASHSSATASILEILQEDGNSMPQLERPSRRGFSRLLLPVRSTRRVSVSLAISAPPERLHAHGHIADLEFLCGAKPSFLRQVRNVEHLRIRRIDVRSFTLAWSSAYFFWGFCPWRC
jgi:hypothetical protein